METRHSESSAAGAEHASALHAIHNIEIQQLNKNHPLYAASSFEDLNLRDELLKAVYKMRYVRPSKVQEHTLPILLRNPPEHLIAQAQTGTGKTAAFSLAILSRINYNDPSPQAIVLAPSRELSRQIVDVIKELATFTPAVITQVIPGADIHRQPITGHVLVGTPGRMTDMLKRRIPGYPEPQRTYIDASKVKILVLDEGDCMLDCQGLGQQSLIIKRHLPPDIQLVFFSATWDDSIVRFAQQFINGPSNQIRLQTYELTLHYVKQFFIDCDNEEDRFDVLVGLYSIMTISQSIIFRRDIAEKIGTRLSARHHQISYLHGGQTPEDRDNAMDMFRRGMTKVLITTNVLARGIDIEGVSLVINYDLPTKKYEIADPVTYLHRIGRTGRFGRLGVSVNFVHDHSSFEVLNVIQQHYNCKIHRVPTEIYKEDGEIEDQKSARLDRIEDFFNKVMKE
ncbi:RNA helicase required for poly(A+) mRNA export [Mortierella sp. GBA43]|nr:RNA helicase required for poly(A+) mRNA export [Mortierella sp. GBA43]